MTVSIVQQPALGLLSVGVAFIAAMTDVRSRLIPNRLTIPAMATGLMLHLVAGGWGECARSLVALVLCGGIFLIFHLAGGMGAGDVKLIAAEGCLLGIGNVAPLLVYTALCGGVLALGLAFVRGKMRRTVANVFALTAHHTKYGLQPHPELNLGNDGTLRLPYAIAIAAGALLTVILPLLSGAGV